MACLIGLCTVISCKKSSPGQTNVPNILSQGDWRITLYKDSGKDETYHFTGYVFAFANGTVTAVRDGNTVSGTYSTGVDDGKNKLYLNFGETEPFEELTDDWQIIEETSTKVSLRDAADHLTFERD